MGDFDPTDYGGCGGDAANTGDPLLDFPGDDNGGEDADRDEIQRKDASLFVIDCAYRRAFEPLKPGGRSLVTEALATAVSVLKTKVVTAPDDKVGVVLYGVRDKLNP